MTTQQPNQPNPQQNPTLNELKGLRRDFTSLREELVMLRADLSSRKPPDITDQVAKGVVLAGVFWFVLVLIIQACFG